MQINQTTVRSCPTLSYETKENNPANATVGSMYGTTEKSERGAIRLLYHNHEGQDISRHTGEV